MPGNRNEVDLPFGVGTKCRQAFMSFQRIWLLTFIILSSCHPHRDIARTPAGEEFAQGQSCIELMEGLLPFYRLPLLKRMDGMADLTIEPSFYGGFVAYRRVNGEVVVKRLSDGQELFARVVKGDDFNRVAYNHKKGRLYMVNEAGKSLRVKGYTLKLIERAPVSYNEVLEVMRKNPYDVRRLPTIPLQMFRFFKKGIVDFFVGRRSVEILKKGADYRTIGMNKPIHPMGIGVEGKMVFHKTRYSGAFAGGEFPLLGRMSISQGNPVKYKKRTWFQRLMGKPASQENRSVAAAFKIFNTNNPNEKTLTANALFQNDLNGEKLDDYISGVMTNQPQINFLKIRKLYEVFTLIGVAKGALTNPNDLKKSFPYMNPQLRPLHQFAELGVDDPAEVVTPKWIKIQAQEGQEVISRDDFREELAETVAQKGLRYDIFLADTVDDNGDILWERAGHIDFENTILSEGVDKNLLFHHDGLRSPFTGELLDTEVVPKPQRAN